MGALSVPAITKGRWRIESLRVSTLALWLGGQGTVRTLTMRCYPAADISKLVEGSYPACRHPSKTSKRTWAPSTT